jgi:TorA maturation chaperone TorD
LKKAKTTGVSRATQLRIAKRRAGIYGILATAYAGPADEKFLGLLRGLKITGDASLPLQNEKLSGGINDLSRWLANNSASPDNVLSSQLAPEFTTLFRGISRRNSPLPPYESVYLEGRLFGESTGKVAEMFGQYSLKPGNNEPPDHISLELDFMRLLCQSESEAGKSGIGTLDTLREEEKFLEEHLLLWAPALCEQIRKFDTKGLYKVLADVTEGWINYDMTEITRLMAESGEQISS